MNDVDANAIAEKAKLLIRNGVSSGEVANVLLSEYKDIKINDLVRIIKREVER